MLIELSFANLREANLKRASGSFHPTGIDEWTPEQWLLCVVGELGKIATFSKRILNGKAERDGFKAAFWLKDSVADLVIYLDLWCARSGIDMGEEVRQKFNKVSAEIGSNVFLLSRAPTGEDGERFLPDQRGHGGRL